MALGSYLRGLWDAVRAQPSDPQDGRYSLIGRKLAGVHVNHENALQVSAVWACMDCIASSMASSDWNVYEGIRHGDQKKALPDDSLQYVLNCRFNSEMTAQSGKRAMGLAAVGMGNGIAEIERDLSNRIIGLWPIEPRRFEIRRDRDTWQLFFRVWQARTGSFVDLEPDQVLHIRGAGLTGFAGDDAIGRAIQSIANAIAIDQFGAAYFANGTQMGVVLEYPGIGKMDNPTYERLKQSWDDVRAGVRNSFRVGFIDGGMKLHQMNVEAEKAQMVEAKHLSIEEICRWFRVPPHKVAHLLRATNNNIEHQGLEFSRDTLRPWKVEIEQECDFKLVPYRVKKFIEIDVDWAEQGDYKSRAEAYRSLRESGVFSVNDILRKLGENTISKADGGDIRSVNGAAVRLEDVGKNMTPAAPKPAPDPDDEPDEDTEVIEAWVRREYTGIASMVSNRRKENAKKEDGDAKARADAIAYMKKPLALLAPILARWPNGMDEAEKRAERVIDGMAPSDAAAELMRALTNDADPQLERIASAVERMESKETAVTVNVAPAAVHVDGPTIHVAAPVVPEREVHLHAGETIVHQAPVNVAGATVNVPERPVTVNVAPAAPVTVNVPETKVPDVKVDVAAPVVNVATPPVTVHVEATDSEKTTTYNRNPKTQEIISSTTRTTRRTGGRRT